ncbi:hypothetical protein NC99_23040 [Sunxiuqinia dokdonensis]|uniref:Uncharacterized protein n=1 Tax=Sunxiuqinia dokdonensis TaxID=1409788 RepID=A0A0L8V9J7_9BACT|nr:hypothetical protein NC99_23040 [Sunxiuqinia dokdonensis]
MYDLLAFLFLAISIHIRKYHNSGELNGESFFYLTSNSPGRINRLFFSC